MTKMRVMRLLGIVLPSHWAPEGKFKESEMHRLDVLEDGDAETLRMCVENSGDFRDRLLAGLSEYYLHVSARGAVECFTLPAVNFCGVCNALNKLDLDSGPCANCDAKFTHNGYKVGDQLLRSAEVDWPKVIHILPLTGTR